MDQLEALISRLPFGYVHGFMQLDGYCISNSEMVRLDLHKELGETLEVVGHDTLYDVYWLRFIPAMPAPDPFTRDRILAACAREL